MASYAARVRSDIGRWVELGLIDRPTGDALARDVEANQRRSISFGTILMMMAGLLFAAALLLLVAANWESLPRLARVIGLFALIFAGYVGGAFLKTRNHAVFAEAAWLVAATAFGGAIALIGQMYHLSGDETTAILVWCAGTAVAAVALRSGPLTVAAAAIAAFWMFSIGVDIWNSSPFPFGFAGIAAVLWLVSYWTESQAARHFLLLSLVGFAVLMAVEFNDTSALALALAAVSAALFAASVVAPVQVERIVKLGGRLPLHALIGFLVGMAIVQFDIVDRSGILVIAALVVFAAIAAAVVLAGRDSRGLRWIAYLGFSLELCFVYVATIGTMLDTAGLFLASGVTLAAVAFIIIRIEKRMAPHAAARVEAA